MVKAKTKFTEQMKIYDNGYTMIMLPPGKEPPFSLEGFKRIGTKHAAKIMLEYAKHGVQER